MEETKVSAAIDRWIDSASPDIKEASLIKYETVLKRYILPEYGEDTVSVLTDKELEGLNERLRSSLSEKTADLVIRTAKRVRNFELLENDEKKSEKKKRDDEIDFPLLSEKEEALLTKRILNDITPSGLGILIALKTGVKIGELLALRRDDIDDKSIFINRSVQRIRAKDSEEHGARTKKVVTQYEDCDNNKRALNLTDDIRTALKSEMISGFGYIISSDPGKFAEGRTLQNHLKKTGDALGINDLNFNMLRDTYAVRELRNGADIVLLSRMLGHKDILITSRRYGKYIREVYEGRS